MCRREEKTILVVQHVECEGLGFFEPIAKRKGFDLRYIRVYRGERVTRRIDDVWGVVVLGGPMGVYEEERYPFIRDEIALVEEVLKRGIPFLGICLGCQILAKACGAPVYKGGAREIGWYGIELTEPARTDPLFIGLPQRMTVFQWHGDTFDIPVGAVNLASSELFPNQLIRVGARAYGIQFHLEITGDMIREWLRENDMEVDPGMRERILRDTPRYMERLLRYGEAVFTRFLRLK